MRQYAVAAIHLGAVARNEPDGANTVEEVLAQPEVINVWWSRPGGPQMHGARIVHVAAQAGMGLKPASVWQIHGARCDVVNRGAAGIDIGGRDRILRRQAVERRRRHLRVTR